MDERDFIADIAENPDDESRWLVFEDWLEERGDWRADVLRLHRDANDVGLSSPKGRSIRNRIVHLLWSHEAPFPFDGRGKFVKRCRRSIATHVELSTDDALRHGDRVVHHALIGSLRLKGLRGRGAEAARCQWLRRVTELDVSLDGLDDARRSDFTSLLDSPQLSGLRDLTLRDGFFRGSTASAIGRLPRRLRSLRLHVAGRCKPSLLVRLAEDGALDELEVLLVQHWNDRHEDAILELLSLPRLREVDLDETQFSESAMTRIRAHAGSHLRIHHPTK